MKHLTTKEIDLLSEHLVEAWVVAKKRWDEVRVQNPTPYQEPPPPPRGVTQRCWDIALRKVTETRKEDSLLMVNYLSDELEKLRKLRFEAYCREAGTDPLAVAIAAYGHEPYPRDDYGHTYDGDDS